MKIETPFDGTDSYGFPFTFHKKWSGMCNPCPESPTETYFEYLFVDILFAGLLAFGFLGLIKSLGIEINEKSTDGDLKTISNDETKLKN